MPHKCLLRGSKWYAVIWDRTRKSRVWIPLPLSVKSQRAAETASRQLQDDLDRKRLNLKPTKPGSSSECRRWSLFSAEILREKKTLVTPEWHAALERFAARFGAFLGNPIIDDITESDCRAYAAERSIAGASHRRKEFSFIRHVLRRAGSRAFDDIRLPPEPKGKIKFLSTDQFAALIAASPPERAFRYLVLANTGARSKEARALRWGDIDLNKKTAVIANADKGARLPSRQVPLPAAVARALAEKKKELDPEPDALLFPHQHNWRRDLKRDCEAAGIPAYTPHDLRHTYCSWLAQAGVHILKIRDLAGHESVRTTEIYMHLAPNDHGAAIAALDRACSNSVAKPKI